VPAQPMDLPLWAWPFPELFLCCVAKSEKARRGLGCWKDKETLASVAWFADVPPRKSPKEQNLSHHREELRISPAQRPMAAEKKREKKKSKSQIDFGRCPAWFNQKMGAK